MIGTSMASPHKKWDLCGLKIAGFTVSPTGTPEMGKSMMVHNGCIKMGKSMWSINTTSCTSFTNGFNFTSKSRGRSAPRCDKNNHWLVVSSTGAPIIQGNIWNHQHSVPQLLKFTSCVSAKQWIWGPLFCLIYIHVYVYICIYGYIRMYTCIPIYISIYISTHIHIYGILVYIYKCSITSMIQYVILFFQFA